MEHRPDIASDLDGLSRLSERLLGLAMRYADRIEALAEDEDERAVALARPLEGLARSYRQTLAMKARLRREVGDLERAERTREILANRPAPDFGVLSRMAEVEEAVSALIWSEHERPEAERLEDELVDVLSEAFDDPAFEDLSLDAQVETVIQRLKPPPPQGEVSAQPTEGGSTQTPDPHSRHPGPPGPADGRPEDRLREAETRDPAAPAVEPSSDEEPPQPYLMPWERAPPGARFPGGSGW